MKILADIGGTYARFGLAGPDGPSAVAKYRAADFENLQAALAHYCAEQSIVPPGVLRLATASYEDEGLWKFVNGNRWVINPADLSAAGWTVECILNDFEAATWALAAVRPQHIRVLQDGPGASANLCLLGPGTGLGLGFLIGAPRPVVQKTHGGHMPLTPLTAEHGAVVRALQDFYGREILVFENAVSGPGLHALYCACCALAGTKPEAGAPEDLLTRAAGRPELARALRLFHEFMGIFAAMAVITAHAYGGVYLTGGVLERLEEHKMFDFESFYKFFAFEAVDSVRRDLRAAPIMRLQLAYPALNGQMEIAND